MRSEAGVEILAFRGGEGIAITLLHAVVNGHGLVRCHGGGP